jgi:hypothetical protein
MNDILVKLDKDYTAEGPDAKWEDSYAAQIIEELSSA